MTNIKQRKRAKTLPVLAILSIITIIAIFFLTNTSKELPIYNPADVNPKLVDASIKHKRHGHKIAHFSLTNQYGETVTQENYKDKIYVADFFFTRCKTICPIMSTNMASIQKAFKKDEDIKFLSMSVTPVIDSVSVLKTYAEKKGAIKGKWNITTGDKKQIYKLARKSFMAVVDEGDGGLQDFIHTNQFVLVDKKKRVRGYYDGTKKEDIKLLIADIKLLKEE